MLEVRMKKNCQSMSTCQVLKCILPVVLVTSITCRNTFGDLVWLE